MQPRQTVLAHSISHGEDGMGKPLQTHTEGLQLERGPASGEKSLIPKLSPSLNLFSLSICKPCYRKQ